MANLTAKRMQEMEEEMNRFEEEILSTKAAEAEAAAANGARNNSRKMIIGAGTFNQVQAQISGKAPNSPAMPPPRPPEEKPRVDRPVAGPLPPPPPPPLDSQSPTVTTPSNTTMFNLRPPPPPPAFVPHQLQLRPMMPPRPPFPPRNMPPGPPCPPGMQAGNMPRHPGMMPPPPPHPNLLQRPPMPPGRFMSPPMMPMNMGNNMPPFNFNHNMMQSSSNAPNTTSTFTQSSATVEKPRVVYAAPPMKRIITENTSKAETIATPVVVEKPSQPKKPRLEPRVVKKQVLPGIELNVPVEEIEAEKKLHYQAPVVPPPAPVEVEHGESTSQEASKKKEKKKKFVRMAAGTVWEDQTLSEWDQDDFRLFCGDLGNEVMDETLARAFSKYPSFVKAKVVRDKRTNKTKGFGFVSFKDPNDFMKAMREMNGKYVGNRPIKLRKSTWRDRQIDVVKKKDKEKKKLGFR